MAPTLPAVHKGLLCSDPYSTLVMPTCQASRGAKARTGSSGDSQFMQAALQVCQSTHAEGSQERMYSNEGVMPCAPI